LVNDGINDAEIAVVKQNALFDPKSFAVFSLKNTSLQLSVDIMMKFVKIIPEI